MGAGGRVDEDCVWGGGLALAWVDITDKLVLGVLGLVDKGAGGTGAAIVVVSFWVQRKAREHAEGGLERTGGW